MHLTLFEVATLVNGVVIGDGNITITALSSIDNIQEGTLVFAESEDYLRSAENSDAAAVLVSHTLQSERKTVIQVAHPTHAFILLLQHFYPEPKPYHGIHPTAVLADDVCLGKEVSIGPYVHIESGSVVGDNCVIKSHVHVGSHVVIGANTTLHPQVTIYPNCRLGNHVIIHACSVIGSDGFGYLFMEGKHVKMPHVGHVIIEDNVEIGANTVIDRATLGATVIGQGTKIDNLVQVAHSVKLGNHNILCAFTGIAGSTTSGNNVIFAANVGVSDHVRIDNNVVLAARAGVPPRKHLKEGNVYLGNPARPKEKALEQEFALTRIPHMRKNLKALTEKVAQINKYLENAAEPVQE